MPWPRENAPPDPGELTDIESTRAAGNGGPRFLDRQIWSQLKFFAAVGIGIAIGIEIYPRSLSFETR